MRKEIWWGIDIIGVSGMNGSNDKKYHRGGALLERLVIGMGDFERFLPPVGQKKGYFAVFFKVHKYECMYFNFEINENCENAQICRTKICQIC